MTNTWTVHLYPNINLCEQKNLSGGGWCGAAMDAFIMQDKMQKNRFQSDHYTLLFKFQNSL